MTSKENLSFTVVGGPSKFDLMLSLFDGNKEPRRTVEFQLDGARGPIVVAITTVQQEDGSGESWCIKGWITNYRRSFDIEGYYSSKGRAGRIAFITPSHYVRRNGELHEVISPADQREIDDYLDWLRGKRNDQPVPRTHVFTTHNG